MTAILTDSTCDLAPQELRRLGVCAVPLDLHVGGQAYTDWAEIDAKTIFRELQQGQTVSSSPPTTDTFIQAYQPLLAQHQDIISIHISSEISDTLGHAHEAAAYLKAEDNIHIVDSGFTSMALAEQVLRAVDLAARDEDADDILDSLARIRGNTVGEFCVGSLEHLHRAGRLSRTRQVVGNVLGLRPVLKFEEGRIVQARTTQEKKAMTNIIASLEKQFGDTPLSVTAINAGQDSDRIAELKTALQGSSLNIQRGRLQLFGAVISANLGPGSYGFMAVPMSVLS
ncbi:DegV family protein [Deinococcus sp.]|uniref:DegV family protein n=1 Tax=Deinococcus sp. TaxID=47478 RepID=UPI003B59DAA4